MDMEIDTLTEAVIGCAYRVHTELGAGFLESVYKNALLYELRKVGLSAQAEVPLDVIYDETVIGHFLADIIVNGVLILELKAVARLERSHEQQLVHYLKATGIDNGLLINFGTQRAEIKRKFRTLKT